MHKSDNADAPYPVADQKNDSNLAQTPTSINPTSIIPTNQKPQPIQTLIDWLDATEHWQEHLLLEPQVENCKNTRLSSTFAWW